ncbi:MAG TPA: hypothetical protein VFS43_47610 [Polyangiaceae bacterium]|nr:hypothetical protein [Polyangiaceae bacterium]
MTAEQPGSRRASAPESEARTALASMRADIVRLVRQRRYEEALTLLYEALSLAPGERELLASIAQIKEFLTAACARRLGGLDRVAGPIPLSAATSPDAMLVARYVDGVSTFGDIAQACPLGRLRTLQVLVALYSKAGALPPPPPPSGEQPPPSGDGRPSGAWPPDAPPSRVQPAAAPSREAWSSEPPGRETWSSGPPSSRRSLPSDPFAYDTSPSGPPSYGGGASGPPSYRAGASGPPSYGAGASGPPSYRTDTSGPPSYGAGASGPPSYGASPPASWRPSQPSPYAGPPEGGEAERPRWGLSPPPPGPEDEAFRAALARGTAAFVQRRYADAVESFRECARLRPDDPSVAGMLARALRGLDVGTP